MTNADISINKWRRLAIVLLLAFAGWSAAWADYKANEDYPTATSIDIEASKPISVEIPLKTFLGDGTVFCRVFVVDAKTNQPLYDLTSSFSMTSAANANQFTRGLFCRTDCGYIEMPRWNSTRGSQNILFTKPANKKWKDIKIMAVKKNVGGNSQASEIVNANNLGIQGDFTYQNFSITSDPSSWDAAVVYNVSFDNWTGEFTPYEGVIGKSGDFETNALGNKRQRVHTWTYDYYVKPGTSVELKGPIVDNSDIEYSAYWRWYDDDTYELNPRITTNASHGSSLSEFYSNERGESAGYIYFGTSDKHTTWAKTASVVYQVPDDENWTGANIAADASRYTDWETGAQGNFREPTLSMRYKFHLHPAKEIADKIKQAILDGDAYEDHGNVTIALSDNASNAYHTLRLDLRDNTQYWFHPFTKKLWNGTAQEIHFNSAIVQAQSFTWAVHIRQGDKTYYHSIVKNNSRLQTGVRFDLQKEDVTGTYYNVEDENDKITVNSFETGREYVIIVYANSFNSTSATTQYSSPVARFNCYFITQSNPQEVDNTYDHRNLDFLEANYTRVGLINFDDFSGMTFDDPKQPYTAGRTDNNSWDKPLPWKEGYYGFTYPQLKSKDNTNLWIGLSPIHGDYVLVKSAWYGKASPGWPNYQGTNPGYKWWYSDTYSENNVLHDRTWSLTSGARHGYFLYVDAADEARPIASLDFEANLCSGSTLILSAAVANLTAGSSESPQLMLKLYGVKYDDAGNAVSTHLIQSFSTGSFASHGITNKGKWYQVFAKTFIHPDADAGNYSHFLVTIDNNCSTTNGADYAIDDIRFYVANSQVEVLQQGDKEDLCDVKDNGAYLKLRMDYSMVRSFLQVTERNKPLYYRICDANGNPVDTTYPVDDTHEVFTDASGNKYGCVWVHSDEAEDANYIDTDVYGYRLFVLANTFFALDPSKTYYISVSLPKETHNDDGTYTYEPAQWGNIGQPCSIYSKIVSIKQQDFVVTDANGQAVSKFFAECGSEYVDFRLSAKLSIPDAVYGGRKEIPWKFDWLIGGDEAYQKFVESGYLTAIQHFRMEYPDAPKWDWEFIRALDSLVIDMDENFDFVVKDSTRLSEFGTTPPKGVYTLHDAHLLSAENPDGGANAFSNSILQIYMRSSDSLNHVIRVQEQGSIYTNIYYIPIPGTYTDKETGVTYKICPDPIRGSIEIAHKTPQIYLGFPTVTYPDEMEKSAKYLRLGLKQMDELKKGTLLSIPINGYDDATRENKGDARHNLLMEEDNGENEAYPCCVRLVSTNDPTVKKEQLATFGKVGIASRYRDGKVAEVVSKDHTITPESKTISIDFSKNTETYSDGTSFTDDIDFHEGYDYQFVMTYHDATKKIGEESGASICFAYTFFTLRIIPEYVTWTGALPTNTNWNNDLNWRRANKAELYKDRDGQNSDNYKDYGTDLTGGLQQYPNSEAPDSTPQAFVPMKFTKVVINPGTSAPYLGTYQVDERMGIINNLYNPNLADGTANIAYDLMVKMDKTDDGTAYECERFYANTCKEVYFRTNKTDLPSGEGQIRNQHYLAYSKAWVDYAMTPNNWNLVAAPLHSVYAGDMYATASTGRQETEAFQPITFDDNNGYSRTLLPFYQRNWNKTESSVITADGGSYDASVPYEETTDTLVLSHWSHAYNDVTVPYEPGRAFSVWPRTTQTSQDKDCTVVRLPKADTTFGYFDYKGNQGTPTGTVDRTLAGYLATTKTSADDPQQLTGYISVSLTDTHVRNGYFLLGNPYMATLEMSSFFNDNPGLYRKYWVLEEGKLVAHGSDDATADLGMVGPMRGFFVKSKVGDNAQTVNFQASQCTTVFYASGQTATTDQPLLFTARDTEGHTSKATVIASPSANNAFVETEDVETLFDSNVGETAPQLFTMAGQMAASINRVGDLRNVPLGVKSPNDETLTLSVEGAEKLSQPLYLYDAVKKSTTLLSSASTVTLKPNVFGRYFLTSEAVAPQPIQTDLRCYSMTPGTIVAATSPSDEITEIAVYDTQGRTLAVYHPGAITYEFRRPAGIYLVTVNSREVAEGRTFKVLVK